MKTNLLQTKLYIPSLRPSLVPRPHLITKLGRNPQCKLILLSAPAGYGKTTLITEWIESQETAVCWLSLDEDDNDPQQFFNYLAAAIRLPRLRGDKPLPTIQSTLPKLLQSPQPLPAKSLMTAFVNDVTAVSTPFTLILDDYHTIDSPEIDKAMAFLLDHMPPQMTLVISSRTDPGFPISRLRARGQLVELRANDLRFSEAEAAQFLQQSMRLTLSIDQIAALENRTEGWIAGLQMAALSMQNREDVDGFIASFTGNHRFIMDYLLEEVLNQQSAEVQDFLMETAVLTRLCAALCQAVTDGKNCQPLLEKLEAANLFIIPLDDERRWYRYHHLFAEHLRNRLQRANPDRLAILHRRAAEWYVAHRYPQEAVHHALAAEDYRLTGRIIQDNWRRLFHQGWISTTLNWLESLPPDLLRRLPPLTVAYCWSLSLQGDFGCIPAYLVQAENALQELVAADKLPESHPEYPILEGQFYLLRSVIARTAGDALAAIYYAEQTLSGLAQLEEQFGSAFTQLGYGAAMIQLGYGYLANGNWEQAALNFSQSRQYARQSENFIAMCSCTFELARIWLKAGRLSEAEAICRETLTLADQPDYANWPAFFIVHIGLADVLRASSRLNEAELHLQQGLDLGRRSGHIMFLAHGYLAAERLYQVQGEEPDARSAHQEAERLLNQVGLTIGDLLLEETAVSHPSSAANPLIEPLTAREQDVLRLIAAGLTNREIGTELTLSLNTIKTHSKNLYGKLNVHTRTQAVNKAQELGLLNL